MQDRWSVDRSVSNVRATGVWVAWSGEPLAWRGTRCGDEMRVGLFLASSQTQRLKVDVSTFCLRLPNGLRNLGSTDLSWPRKELYRELVVGSTTGPLCEQQGWTAKEMRSHWNWAPESSFLNISEFSLTWWLARNALPLLSLNFSAGLADMPDCARCGSSLEETAEHAFYNCERVRPFWDHVEEWKARIEPKQLVLLDLVTSWTTFFPHFMVRSDPSCSSNGDLDGAKEGLYDDANFSNRDMVLYFRHQLRVKIRCDRKRLDRITFN